ncbi:MAG: hypothetical protein Q8M40_13485 [Legionella sp.]|nr:hypothetical protein [Legionella sp.]
MLTIHLALEENNVIVPVGQLLNQLEQESQGRHFRLIFSPEHVLPHPSMKTLLPQLPKNCIGFDLSSMMKITSMEDLALFEEHCALIPPHVRHIFAYALYNMVQLSPEAEIRFLKALPQADSLNLDTNKWSLKVLSVLADYQQPQILSLMAQPWWFKSTNTLTGLVKLPSTLHSLHFSLCATNMGEQSMLSIWSQLPPSIHKLGLETRNFKGVAAEELKLCSKNITTLKWHCIGNNNKVVDLKSVVKNTPPSVHTLELTRWHFGDMKFAQVFSVFLELPDTVKTLILDNNSFERWSIEELIVFLNNIPDTVTHISLLQNPIFASDKIKTCAQQEYFLEQLASFNAAKSPEQQRTIDLDYTRFKSLQMAALPIMSAVKQEFFKEDIANVIATFLGSKTATFFKGRRQEISHQTTEAIAKKSGVN